MEADATVKDNEMKGPTNACTDVQKEITSLAANDTVTLLANSGKKQKKHLLVLLHALSVYFTLLELLIVDIINLAT